ncbi:MAG: PSD1 and planctomycete cytochrome C domain-containing protein [Planctomycetota bacterium]
MTSPLRGRRSLMFLVSWMLILGVTRELDAAEGKPSPGEKLFALHVKSIFAEKCLACHGADPDEIQGGFDLRSRDSALDGGDSFGEDVIRLNHGQESFLYLTVAREEPGYEMPPKEADALTEEQAWLLRDWIDAGAPWPEDEVVAAIRSEYAEGVQVETSKALSEDWQNRRYESAKLWAYQPVAQLDVPDSVHPIDHFIDAKLTAAGLHAAGPASAPHLIRRMTFGMTGLPPTPDEVTRFARAYAEDSDLAVEQLIERLHASPHYGEQFAARWLDVARYADSAGFANDFCRPTAWRYRDYVVRAFNEDKPYGEFIREQIAGDEIDPSRPENLIAVGFLRMGPWEQTAMSVFKKTRQQWLDDVTDSVGQTFLAHAMQCAKCHDHKFDPIPTRDYYRMMAVFSTTQFAQRPAEFLASENRVWFEASEHWVNEKIRTYRQQSGKLRNAMEKRRKKEESNTKVGNNGLDPGDEASIARMTKNIQRHEWERDRVKPVALSVYTGKTVERKSVMAPLQMPQSPWKGKGSIEPDTILDGGDAFSPGDSVRPGALSAADSLGGMETIDFPDGMGKRRRALAEWIADPSNPLTPRVIVNRVWSWHFGKGIAKNPNNFGGTGALPTHPELLDFLATWFLRNGGSIKKLNHLILTSQTYRRGTQHPDPEQVQELDPTRSLYATFQRRRLTAEELRDAMLACSGELNRDVGGIPVRPDINLEVAFQPRQIMGGTASVYEPDPLPSQRNRRSLYAEKIRGLRDPFMESFNQPGPDKSCELRETSTVAPQALTLMNSGEVYDRALAFAMRLLDSADEAIASSDHAIVERAFVMALGRKPSAQEIGALVDHWQQALSNEHGNEPIISDWPSRIDRTVMAEKTGEPYTFTEVMPAYEQYQPDAQPADVSPRVRALAQACLVLFNLNEFAYLD